MNNIHLQPLTWDEAKKKAAKASNVENWDQFIEQIVNNPVKALRIEGGYLFAAELYASSRVREVEEENKRLQEELQSWKDEHAQIVDDYGIALKDKDEKIERLQERLEAAENKPNSIM